IFNASFGLSAVLRTDLKFSATPAEVDSLGDDVEGTSLHLLVNLADVLPENADHEELNAEEERDEHDHRRPPGDGQAGELRDDRRHGAEHAAHSNEQADIRSHA